MKCKIRPAMQRRSNRMAYDRKLRKLLLEFGSRLGDILFQETPLQKYLRETRESASPAREN